MGIRRARLCGSHNKAYIVPDLVDNINGENDVLGSLKHINGIRLVRFCGSNYKVYVASSSVAYIKMHMMC